MKTRQELVDDCGNSGKAGKRDGDESHLLAEPGEEGLLQRGLPQVQLHLLCHQVDSDEQVRGKEPQGDGEAGGRHQGVGRSRGRLSSKPPTLSL